MYRLFGPHNQNLGSSLCYNLFDYNASLGIYHTIYVYFSFLCYSLSLLKMSSTRNFRCKNFIKAMYSTEQIIHTSTGILE